MCGNLVESPTEEVNSCFRALSTTHLDSHPAGVEDGAKGIPANPPLGVPC